MIISRTPFRISFFGGGTDYPAWYSKEGGAVLTTSIDKYCYLTCRYLPPFFNTRYRLVYSKIEECQSLEQLQHPAAREILRYIAMEQGIEIHHDGDLPARSGMGSSSSFTVGLIHALHALNGKMPSKTQLAAESIHIEQTVLHEAVGSQDQIAVAHGGFNHITFHKTEEPSVRPMTLPADRLRELNDHLMLVYTGIKRTASEVASSFVNDIDSKASKLKAIQQMVDEGLSILTGTRDISQFGLLLNRAWQTKREMSAVVSNGKVDAIYAEATASGATGGKLLGAGGGGFMLLFAPPSQQQDIRDRLRGLIHVPFKFENSGSQIIFYDPEEDYSGDSQMGWNGAYDEFQELTSISSREDGPS